MRRGRRGPRAAGSRHCSRAAAAHTRPKDAKTAANNTSGRHCCLAARTHAQPTCRANTRRPAPTHPVVAAALIPRLDLFISLIGALASSCLAIIFPAIIQLCTFWNEPERADGAGVRPREGACAPGPGRARARRALWLLFVCKNGLLVAFGLAGLLTGSWMSLVQLGVGAPAPA